MLPSLKNAGNLKGKKVLLRVDFNVPTKDGLVAKGGEWRLRAVLPTLNYLAEAGAKIIIITHLGRPKNHDINFSLYPVFLKLGELWKSDRLFFSTDVLGDRVKKYIDKLKEGESILLENLRFYSEEEKNDETFSRGLASLGEFYVNDAFADSHRAHASIVGLPRLLPSAAGFLLEKEVNVLSTIRDKPRRPLVFIMGGAKAETKLKLVKEFLNKSEAILLGGVLANTLFLARNLAVGKSVVDEDLVAEVQVLNLASKNLYLPTDIVTSKSLAVAKEASVKLVSQLAPDEFIADIGPKTIEAFAKIIKSAKMIIWNGAVGYTEIPAFKKGSLALAKAMVESSAEKIIGGGDLISFLAEENLIDKMTYVSTGGGAMLEFLAGEQLPGIKILENKEL